MAALRLYDDSDESLTGSEDEETQDTAFLVGAAEIDHHLSSQGHQNDPAAALVGTVDDEEESDDTLVSASRAYQLEMFEASLKRNVIVAMDTGTGKTRVAILRIRAELERSPPSKIAWFLAPTVFLCDQQFEAISSQLPGVQVKVITSQSGVNAWSTQDVWDNVLLNVRVVVATPQVLLVRLGNLLALLAAGYILFGGMGKG
ncbi:RNA helicase rnase [Niveomyces insectorum RCEF 264]|uniref:RNA helicase rnase n=1 Tax=Niveomyces insectorum RCEF 264 TaxID=1081102 RepID=A0A167Z864_9HYPO|nr:RNA helicase rnase [Niveomyces insectorum RCEF 264]